MGTCHSKSDKIKRDKNYNRQKMFKFGISFGRNDLNLEVTCKWDTTVRQLKTMASLTNS